MDAITDQLGQGKNVVVDVRGIAATELPQFLTVDGRHVDQEEAATILRARAAGAPG